MSYKHWHCRSISQTRVDVLSRIRNGQFLYFDHPKGKLKFSIEYSPGKNVRHNLQLMSAAGEMALEYNEAFLSLMSRCPAAVFSEKKLFHDEHQWYWQLFSYYLHPPLKDIWGLIQPSSCSGKKMLPCILKISGEGVFLENGALIPEQSILAILKHECWQPVRNNLPKDLKLIQDLIVGTSRIKIGNLRKLKPGQIVLCHKRVFDSEGKGSLVVGDFECELSMLRDSYPLEFNVVSIKESIMSEETEIAVSDVYENSAQNEGVSIESIDSVRAELSICAGTVSTTLGQLTELGVGSVLIAAGEEPGYASIKYFGRTIARGELVEINNQLGVQITQMEFIP